MKFTLKRGTVYTPITFQLPNLVNNKYFKYEQEDYYISGKSKTAQNSFDLKDCLVNESFFYRYIYYSRSSLPYSEFTGGMLERPSLKILALLVTHNESRELYVIINDKMQKYPTYFNRLKKSAKELNIDKKHILIWSESQISKEFTVFTPTMQDYLPEVQEQNSIEFLALQA